MTKLIKLDNASKKTTATQLDKYFEIYYEKCQKRGEKKVLKTSSYLNML